LHRLYPERRNGGFDDFHAVSKATAKEELRADLEISYKLSLSPQVFVTPEWKLNENSIEVLKKWNLIQRKYMEGFCCFHIILAKR